MIKIFGYVDGVGKGLQLSDRNEWDRSDSRIATTNHIGSGCENDYYSIASLRCIYSGVASSLLLT